MSASSAECSEYLAARLIACPVVIICAQDLEHGGSDPGDPVDHAMISSVSYANLKPLILASALRHHSTTGGAILKTQKLSASVLSYSQLAQLESMSLDKQSQAPTEYKLQKAGFSLARFASGILYIKNSVLAIDLRVVHSTALDGFTMVLAQADDTLASADNQPLIRYNRLYQTTDGNRLGQSKDDYPV